MLYYEGGDLNQPHTVIDMKEVIERCASGLPPVSIKHYLCEYRDMQGNFHRYFYKYTLQEIFKLHTVPELPNANS